MMADVGIWRSVDVWPNGGFADRSWDRAGDEDYDAFARSAQRVCAVFNNVLPGLGLTLPQHSHLRLSAALREYRPKPPPGTPVMVRLDTLERDGFHVGHVVLPDGVADLSPTARGLLALDVLHIAGERLAELVGWNKTLLEPARQAVLDAGLGFSWSSAWKNSPDRRHKARLTYRLDDDGMGRGRIEVSDGISTRATPEEHCPGGYAYLAKSVRWDGSAAVTFAPFGSDHLAPTADVARPTLRDFAADSWTPDASARVELADLLVPPEPPTSLDADTPRPPVVRLLPPSSDRDAIQAGSGGDGMFTPLAYTNVLSRTTALLTGPEWQQWWGAGHLGLLQIYWWLGHPDLKYAVRRARDADDPEGRHKWVATIQRPYGSIPDEADHPAAARDDVVALMAKVQARTGLGPHPEIPLLPVDWDQVRAVEKKAHLGAGFGPYEAS